ncbi:hypothetical protein EA756_09695 [Acinetobacter lactucae]|uniref:Uncharacterized protein n=1 Tax=Acinetobacter lactucae TaxID=1785128 RepID=A0A3R9S3H0_9GAMM|nr:hypothetical protein [Acinetobacter lactucae]RSO57744.1 hypothetical protein EA756_09695 [Acinetobacter lactucae]
MSFKSLRKSYDEYVLRFDSFPDLIFIGNNVYRDLYDEFKNNPNWKVLFESKYKIDEIMGCKVVIVPSHYYDYRFDFFEFDDLEECKNKIFDEGFRRSSDYLTIMKNLPSIYDCKLWEASPPTKSDFDYCLNIPFAAIEQFKLENLTKSEIEERQSTYKIRKGIYEPESRF